VVFIFCHRLNSQYFEAPKSGVLKMRGLPAVAGTAGGFLRHWKSHSNRICRKSYLLYYSDERDEV